MKITIESTDETPTLDGVECRLWRGVSEGGVACLVYVHRIAVREDQNPADFEAELFTRPNPVTASERGRPVVIVIGPGPRDN